MLQVFDVCATTKKRLTEVIEDLNIGNATYQSKVLSEVLAEKEVTLCE